MIYILIFLNIFGLYFCNFKFKVLILSFLFNTINKYKILGSLFGVRYINDYELDITRDKAEMYIPFFQKIAIELFLGVDIKLKDIKILSKFIKYQAKLKNIDFKNYFQNIVNKRITINEFETFLCEILLTEINKTFDFKDDDKLCFNNMKILRFFANNISKPISLNQIIFILKNFYKIIKLSNYLKTLEPVYRIMIIGSQVTIADRIIKYIISNNGNLSNINLCDILRNKTSNDKTSDYFVLLYNPIIYIVKKNKDNTNSPLNKVFGVKGFQCPAAPFVCNLINENIPYLKTLNILIENTPIYISSGNQQILYNKDDIYITIN